MDKELGAFAAGLAGMGTAFGLVEPVHGPHQPIQVGRHHAVAVI